MDGYEYVCVFFVGDLVVVFEWDEIVVVVGEYGLYVWLFVD